MENPQVKNTFNIMLRMQIDLLNQYIAIEDLPSYPLDLTTKASQKLIKDFTQRITEELSEGFIDLEKCHDMVSTNQNGPEVLDLLANYNTEIADALHYLLEVLIYSGVDNSILDSLLYHYCHQDLKLEAIYQAEDVWGTLLRLGGYMNHQFPMIRGGFSILNTMQRSETPEYSGGNTVSLEHLDRHSVLLWEFTCTLMGMANQLKNRSHVQAVDKDLDKIKYWEKILYVMIKFAQYLAFAGVTNSGLFKIYYQKNKINHERILSGY